MTDLDIRRFRPYIHNAAEQGMTVADTVKLTGLPVEIVERERAAFFRMHPTLVDPWAPATTEWPGWTAPPKRNDTWAKAMTAMAREFWTAHRRLPTRDEGWDRLASAPPKGYPIQPDPDVPRKVLLLSGEAPLERHSFDRRFGDYTTPPKAETGR